MAGISSQYTYFNVTHPCDYVGHVEINRPSKLNAFIEPMWLELRNIFDQLSYDPSTRVVLFSGAGPKAFTAGLDVQTAMQSGPLASASSNLDGARTATSMRRHIHEFQDCVSSIEKCEKPVINILHGHSLGLALDLATCADIRICTSSTSFGVKEVDIGLAADIGTLSRLPKCVSSYSWVKDVCLSARTFGAEEALRVGLVSSVWDSKEGAIREGLRMAEVIAGKSPVAVQSTKEILNHSRDRTVEEGLRYTQVWNSAALQTRDVPTAAQAGFEKKRPRFEKL